MSGRLATGAVGKYCLRARFFFTWKEIDVGCAWVVLGRGGHDHSKVFPGLFPGISGVD